MSENGLDSATFLPSLAPRGSVLDYSGTLSANQIAKLNGELGHAHGVAAKVVVLPQQFHVTDMTAFTEALAHRWHADQGSRALMVISLKDAKVRVVLGDGFRGSNVDGTVITNDIIPTHFIPYIRKHDLADAIGQTIKSIDARSSLVAHAPGQSAISQTPSTSAPGAVPIAPPSADHAGIAFWPVVCLIAVAVVVAVWAAAFASRKKDNLKLKDSFDKQASALYQDADQIGQASEYLDTQQHPDLAKRIADFFNRLAAMQEAANEVDRLQKQNKVWQVRDGYLNLRRMLVLLAPEADSLKTDVDAATGGVAAIQEKRAAKQIEINQPIAGQPVDDGERIRISDRMQRELQYTRPSWTYEPAYYQPVSSGLGGLGTLMMIMNQMEMNSRIGQLESDLRHEQMRDSGFSNNNYNWNSEPPREQHAYDNGGNNWNDVGGGSWSDEHATTNDSGGGWSDSGGGDFSGGGWDNGQGFGGEGFDAGGQGWDSGGGDLGGGDSGGGDWS